jgi:hypothetical protein
MGKLCMDTQDKPPAKTDFWAFIAFLVGAVVVMVLLKWFGW